VLAGCTSGLNDRPEAPLKIASELPVDDRERRREPARDSGTRPGSMSAEINHEERKEREGNNGC
jgi:hypothetical protein